MTTTEFIDRLYNLSPHTIGLLMRQQSGSPD